MNALSPDPDLFDHQAKRLQDIVENLFACCQARIALQSERFGLPPAALRALIALGESRYLAPGELGRRLGVTKSRVTAVTTGLSRHKLIEKHPDPADARVTLLSLTPAGRRARDEVCAFMKGLFHSMQGASVGSAKKTSAPSPRASRAPRAMPPGAPPTPQGKYRHSGCSGETSMPKAQSWAGSRSPATA